LTEFSAPQKAWCYMEKEQLHTAQLASIAYN